MQPLNWHTTSLLDLRSPDGAGHLLVLLFSFHFSFFLWIKLGLFLLFPFAFVFFPLVTHFCFSFLESELLRTGGPKPRLGSWRLAHRIVWRSARRFSRETDSVYMTHDNSLCRLVKNSWWVGLGALGRQSV